MKKVVIFFFVAVLATSCNAQETNSSQTKTKVPKEKIDSIKQPKERWSVNKEVDEEGNVIRYDSVYSWSSHGNLKDIASDSIFNRMRALMNKRFSAFSRPEISGLSTQDSIMSQFFADDFFSDSVMNFPSMQDMIKQMEAMRQQFFNNQQRYIIPPENKRSKQKPIKEKQI